MINSGTANGKLFSEISDLHEKLINLTETVGGLSGTMQHERTLIREGGKLNVARQVIEDEIELRKVKKESSWFQEQSVFKDETHLKDELLLPRMFSIKQVRDLFYAFLHGSQVANEAFMME